MADPKEQDKGVGERNALRLFVDILKHEVQLNFKFLISNAMNSSCFIGAFVINFRSLGFWREMVGERQAAERQRNHEPGFRVTVTKTKFSKLPTVDGGAFWSS